MGFESLRWQCERIRLALRPHMRPHRQRLRLSTGLVSVATSSKATRGILGRIDQTVGAYGTATCLDRTGRQAIGSINPPKSRRTRQRGNRRRCAANGRRTHCAGECVEASLFCHICKRWFPCTGRQDHPTTERLNHQTRIRQLETGAAVRRRLVSVTLSELASSEVSSVCAALCRR